MWHVSTHTPSRSGSLHAVDHRGQVLEPAAQARSLPGRGFEQALRLDAARLPMHFIERPHDRRDAGRLAAGGVRARMRHDVRNPKPIGPQHLDDERIDRLLPQHRIGAGQIDEIRIVRQRMRDSQLLRAPPETSRTSSSVSSLARHWLLFFVKTCTQSQPFRRAISTAL